MKHVYDVRDFGAGQGADDTDAIQATFDEATLGDPYAVGVVRFPTGRYKTSGPVYASYDLKKYPWPALAGQFSREYDDTGPGARRKRVVIEGVGSVCLTYIGEPTDQYMLYYAPIGGLSGCQTLSNLRFECNYRTRGVFVYHPGYGCDIARGCQIKNARGVGLDVLSAYSGTLANVYVRCSGIAVRLIGCNSMLVHGGKFEVGNYAGGEVWKLPEVDETVSIISRSYRPAHAIANQAALTVLKTDRATFQNICVEGVQAKGRAATYVSDSNCLIFQNIRYEGIHDATCLMRFDNSNCNLVELIRNGEKVDNLFEFEGRCSNNRLRMISGAHVRNSVVALKNPQNSYGNVLESVDVRGMGMQPIPYVVGGDNRHWTVNS